MAKVIDFGTGESGEQMISGEILLRREQIAAQVVAVMQAHFSRPGPEEMREILHCADGQITALQQWRSAVAPPSLAT